MFVLMLDDGMPYGPFETAEAAVRCDLQAMAIDSLPEYQTRAQELLGLNSLLSQWAAAKVLVGEVDHVIFEWKIVVGGYNGESYNDVFGGGPEELLHDPDSLILNAQAWAKSGIRPGETKVEEPLPCPMHCGVEGLNDPREMRAHLHEVHDMAPGEFTEIYGK